MARKYAAFNVPIWQDDDWRALPREAQHLYMVLWTHPVLDYAGVVGWHPGRIAALAHEWTAEQVIEAAQCLEARLFLVIDPDTEECLVRSWFRFDGVMEHNKLCVSFANAFAAVASNDIRGVLVHEARKVRKLYPDLIAWTKPQVLSILDLNALDPRDRDLPPDPLAPGLAPTVAPGVAPGFGESSPCGSPKASPRRSPRAIPVPVPVPSTGTTDAPAVAGAERAKTRGTRIPEPFPVTPEMVAWARRECPGLDHRAVTIEFVDYWRAVAGAKGVKLDWEATWRNWLRREGRTGGKATAAPGKPNRDQWMDR